MLFTFHKYCGSPTLDIKCTPPRLGKFTSHKKEIMQCTCLSNQVRVFVRCSAVFSRMKYLRQFGCREKQIVRISVNLKLLLNRKELERNLYMKKMRLHDIYPTAIVCFIPKSNLEEISKKTLAVIRHGLHHFQNCS